MARHRQANGFGMANISSAGILLLANLTGASLRANLLIAGAFLAPGGARQIIVQILLWLAATAFLPLTAWIGTAGIVPPV